MDTSKKTASSLLLDYLKTKRKKGQRTIWLTEAATKSLFHSGSTPLATTAPPTNTHSADKEKSRQLLIAELKQDQQIQRIDTLRDTLVFSVGNLQADLMLIGEAPGADEELEQEPFVGKAGQLLTKILKTMGFSREDVYISNIVKYRPKIPHQRTNNRKPTWEEMEPFRKYIFQEIDLVCPQVIVALGATAYEGLTQEKAAVGRVRGIFQDLQGTPMMTTYHPSYLLHNPANTEKRKVWEDLLQVMEKLHMPISDKQRNFFLTKH